MMRPRTVSLVMASIGWVMATASWPAMAQDASNAAAAEALFREGRALMAQGRVGEACPKLAASQRLDPGAGTLINLGACYVKNGQTASAWATYREAAASAARSGRGDWEEHARARASEIEPTLSRLTIEVPAGADVPGLLVERDGVVVDRAMWGSPIPVDPGVHPVTASAPRKQQWSTSVSVGPNGARVRVGIPPLGIEQSASTDAPVSPPGSPPPRPGPATPADRGVEVSSSSSQRTWGLVLGGAGVAGVVLGGVFGLQAKSKHDDALAYCADDNRCSAEGIALDEEARDRAMLANVTVGLGLAALAGGVVLYVTAPNEAEGPSVALTARSTGAGASLGLGGVW